MKFMNDVSQEMTVLLLQPTNFFPSAIQEFKKCLTRYVRIINKCFISVCRVGVTLIFLFNQMELDFYFYINRCF